MLDLVLPFLLAWTQAQLAHLVVAPGENFGEFILIVKVIYFIYGIAQDLWIWDCCFGFLISNLVSLSQFALGTDST